MATSAVYVCKAARRPRYRRENLHLLAAERGTVVEATYNPMWVAPALLDDAGAVPRGTPVVFLFTDRPYTQLVPVRQGEVLEVERAELMIRLRVLLRGWIGAPAGDVAAFTRAVREASGGEVPGEKFVFRKRDDVEFERFFDEREDEGWRRAVDAVLDMSSASEDDAYRASVFFRPVGLRVGDELHHARRLPLEPGTRAALALRFHNPHLTDDDVARHTLRVLASDGLRVEAPERFPRNGALDIPFEVTGERPELTVEIGPAPAEHTAVTQRFTVRGRGTGAWGARARSGGEGAGPAEVGAAAVVDHHRTASGERSRPPAGSGAEVSALREDAATSGPGEASASSDAAVAGGDRVDARAHPPAIAADEVLRLYDLVWRNARFEPGDDLDVLDAFQRLLPGEERIAERRALLHAERGEDDVAYRILRDLDPERLGDDARFALFGLALRRESGPAAVQRVLSLDLVADGRFPRLLAAIEAADEPALARLLPELIVRLPTDRVRDVVTGAGARLESGDAIAKLAEALYLATGDAAWAFAYLDDRRRTLRLADPAVTDLLLELAASGGRTDAAGDLGEEAARRIGNLIEHGELADARARLRQAGRGLRRAERDRLYHRIADRLRDRSQFAEAAEVMVELAWAACETGDLAEATEAAVRGRGLWGRENAGGAAAEAGATGTATGAGAREPDWLRQACDHVEAAWRACEELVEWRRTEEDRLRERLRARYLNQRILIAGGFRRQEWIDQLEDLTGAKVDWAERYRDEGSDLDAFATRIRNGHYAVVVHLWQKSGHEVGDRLKAACEEAETPWVYATTAGVRGVVEGVGGFQYRRD